VYPDPRVAELITANAEPVRAHIKDQPQMWGRFGARWTPTVMFLDARGREQHRIEGFLPTDEFLGQLELGFGYAAVGMKDWATAERHFRAATEQYPDTAAAPEGLYWVGVARYSASHDAKELQETARAFERRYRDSVWAKRTVVWKPQSPDRAAA